MTGLPALLRECTRLLTGTGVGYALVGGLAVSVRTEPRFTRDIDLAVAVADDGEAEHIVAALRGSFTVVSALEHSSLDRLAAVRLAQTRTSPAGPVVDLLFASSGIEPEVVAAATPLRVFSDCSVPVARIGHLLALKLLARGDDRPQDDVDLHALLEVADDEERALADAACTLIIARGAARERDLTADWRRLADR